ncbi:MAG: hypothetical protein GF311_18850 [Candidatus Lokiarchaeota archaeon]|nr:hypothetical protein [Candidatus Lokiarchaeota archaeon]
MVELLDFPLSRQKLRPKATVGPNKCSVDDLCRYCNPYYMLNCCLFKKILLSKNRAKKLNFKKCYSNKCINSSDCLSIVNEKLFGQEKKIYLEFIPKKADIFSKGYKVNKSFPGFKQNFIPRIDISPPENIEAQIKIIEDARLQYLAISLQDILSKDKDQIIKRNYLKQGIHDKLNYRGKILLLTNIWDIFCEKLLQEDNLTRLIEELKILKPDVMTTLDANFYLSQPLFITLFQLERVIRANKILNNSDIYQIGLIPPIPFIFKDLLKFMLKIGYKSVCVPLLEINKYRNFKLRDKTVGYLNDFKRKYSFEYLLISTNPYIKTYVDCFSSQTWIKKNITSLEFDAKVKIWEQNLKNSIKNARIAKNQKLLYQYSKNGGVINGN